MTKPAHIAKQGGALIDRSYRQTLPQNRTIRFFVVRFRISAGVADELEATGLELVASTDPRVALSPGGRRVLDRPAPAVTLATLPDDIRHNLQMDLTGLYVVRKTNPASGKTRNRYNLHTVFAFRNGRPLTLPDAHQAAVRQLVSRGYTEVYGHYTNDLTFVLSAAKAFSRESAGIGCSSLRIMENRQFFLQLPGRGLRQVGGMFYF